MKKTFAFLLSLSILMTLGGLVVYAQEDDAGGGGGGGSGNTLQDRNDPLFQDRNDPLFQDRGIRIPNPFKDGTNSIFALLKLLVNEVLLPIGGVLAVLAFIYSGFLFVTAGGSDDKIQNARRALLYTAIGTAILLGAWVLANAICRTIGQLGGPVCPT